MRNELNRCTKCGGHARLAKSIAIHGLKITLLDCMYECRKCGFHAPHVYATLRDEAKNEWNAANPKEDETNE